MRPDEGEGTGEPSGTGVLQSISKLWRAPPAYVAVTGWSAAGAVLVGAYIAVVSDVLATLIFGHPVLGILSRRSGLLSLEAGKAYQLASLTCQSAIVALTVAASGCFGGSVRETLALRPPAGGRLTYITGALLCLLVVMNVHVLISVVAPSDAPVVRHTSRIDWALDAVATIIGAPLAEELLFRGFLTAALARSALGYAGAAVVTSAIWTGAHYTYSFGDLVVLFAMGLFLSWLLWRTGSIRVPILCHACVGAVAFFGGTTVGW